MKRTQIIAITFCLLFFSVACHRGNTISIINDDDNLYINYNGEIKFNDDETVISSISHNGYLKYRRNEKRLNAENGVDGRIKYEMYVNGRKLNADDVEGKQFLADVVKDMIDIGFDAKGRLDRLYRKGGTEAVLNNFDNLKMDFVKNMYLEYLLSIDGLSEDQVKSIARKIALGSGSDYDKGRLLEKFPVEYLGDSLAAHAWFEAAKSIGNDYEKTNALVYMARQPISKEQFNQIVDVANTLGSDYDKANILKELIYKRTFAEENFDKTLDAVSYIGSDYEKANLLKAMIKNEKPSGDHFNKLLDVAERLGSGYDKSSLIRDLVENGLPAGADFNKLLSAVIQTGSEFDKANLLRDICMKGLSADEQWIAVINAVAEISSDNDKSSLLVAIAPGLPKNDQVRSAYMKASRTINDGNDLGRAVKALE